MDIAELDEMGLIDSATEFIHGFADSSVIYSQEEALNITPEDLGSYGNKVTYVTIPNLVQIVQDGGSQSVGYLINNNQLSVNQPIIVNQESFVDAGDVASTLKDEGSLQKQLSDYLTSPAIIDPSDADKSHPKTNTRLSPSHNKRNTEAQQLVDPKEDVDPPDKTGPMNCDKCNVQFSSWNTYKKHKWTHLHDKPFQCSFCHESFNYEMNLNLHLATHSVENPMKICPVCKKQFNRIASLKAHIMLHEREESLFCTKCAEEFSSPIYLQRHMNEHRTGKMAKPKPVFVKKVYRCRLCDQTFDTATNCKLHQIKYHKGLYDKNGKKRNPCEYCKKCFDKPSQLLRHKRIHTGERPYECELCTRAFNQKGSLQIHMLKHTKVRPYVCQYCKGTFSQKGNLKAHVRRLHMEPEGDEIVYKCKMCTCIFRNHGSLRAHFTKVHNEIDILKQISNGTYKQIKKNDSSSDSSNKENENSKKDACRSETITIKSYSEDGSVREETVYQRKLRTLVCPYCSKNFKRPGDLVRHIRTHTLEKPFKCKLCGKGFSLQSTLSVHIKTHNDVKKYVCPTCSKCYSSARNLKLHRKKHLLEGSVADNNTENNHVDNQATSNKANELVYLDQVDLSSFDGNTIIVTESGNIVDMSSNVEEDDESNGVAYKCTQCNMVFKKELHLNIHHQIHNANSYKCDYCPCSFNSKNTLNKHLKQHPVLSNHTCNICDEQFTSESSFHCHMEAHEVDSPWACPLCGVAYLSYNTALKHIVFTHPKANKNSKPIKAGDPVNIEKGQKKELTGNSKNTLPIVVMNQTPDVSLQPNQILLIANQDGGCSIVAQAGQVDEYSVYHEGDLIINPAQSNNSEKQGFENSLIESCLFTLQPEIDVGNSLMTSNLPNIISQPQPVNSDMTNLLLPNISDFPIGKTTHLLEKPHTCITCEKSFSTAFEYEEHLKLHKKSSGWAEVKDTPGEYNSPKEVHSTLFSCSICSLNFLSFEDLTHHEEEHISSKFICEICRVQFTTQQELKVHSQEHKIIEEIIQCSLCLSEFLSEEDFQAHCHKYHAAQMFGSEKKKTRLNWRPPARRLTEEETKVLSTIEPDNASEKVLLQSLLEKERYEHSVKEEPKPPEVHRHKCKYCPKSFRKPSDLIRHLRTHTGEKPYKCNSCNKRFSIKSAASSHMKTHTKDKSYECYICSKMFSTTGSLKIHMRLHTGLNPFACHLCDAKFRTSGHKKAHLLKHQRMNLENKDKNVSPAEPATVPVIEEMSLPERSAATPPNILPSDQGSQYLVPLKTGIGNGIGDLNSAKTDEFLTSLEQEESVGSTSTQTSKFLLNISDEGGGSGDAPRYFLSIKDGGNGEDAFVLETINEDQIIVTITKGDSDVTKTSIQEETVSSVCFEQFERKSDLDVHCLTHELDRGFNCPECSDCFSLEEELRAHKCIKSTTLDLSLDNDLFLFS